MYNIDGGLCLCICPELGGKHATRHQRMERTVLSRRTEEVETPYGKILIKISGAGRTERIHPEYESVSAAARRNGAPFKKVYEAALFAYLSR